MDSKDKAKHYLRLTEGVRGGKPEGTQEYVEMRIRDGQKTRNTLKCEILSP